MTTADEDLNDLRALKREVSDAWVKANAHFVEMVSLNDRLIAVGGTATTRPDKDGYCARYRARSSGHSFAMGVCRANEALNEEFGEELHSAEQRWREAATKWNAAKATYEARLKKAIEE